MIEDSGNVYGKLLFDAMYESFALLEVVRNTEGNPYDYRFIEVNPQFENMAGVVRTDIVGKTARQTIPIFDDSWYSIYHDVATTGAPRQFEHSAKGIDRHFWVSVLRPTPDRIISLFIDISLHKKAKDTLQIHRILFENAHDIVLYVRMDGTITDANQCACEKYGYSKQELLSMSIQNIRHPSTMDEFEYQMHQADTGGVMFDCIHVRCDGSSFPVEVSARSTDTANGRLRIHIIRDVTNRKEQEEKITWLASHDALTGIPNRTHYIMRLEEEIQRSLRTGTTIAVMLFDVDKFKFINDRYGHEAGDVVLRQAATRVQGVLRTTDQIGRLGGDEFVIMQSDVKDCAGIALLAQRIQAAAGHPIPYRDVKIQVKISIGISLFPQDAADSNGLLHCADKAMYEAKRQGGGDHAFFSCCQPPCTENRLCRDAPKILYSGENADISLSI